MDLMLGFRKVLARIEAATSGYLVQIGWPQTRATRTATDVAGRATPWFTYPAIRLLQDRVQRDWRVLEFGAGMGTVWWSEHAGTVTAIEHDDAWANVVSTRCSAALRRADGADAGAYAAAARDEGPFDVIVVDGLHRNTCLAFAPTLLSERGVIVLDAAQREEYRPGVQALCAQGFRLIELHGPQPVSKHPGCTSIFYRDGNVLGL